MPSLSKAYELAAQNRSSEFFSKILSLLDLTNFLDCRKDPNETDREEMTPQKREKRKEKREKPSRRARPRERRERECVREREGRGGGGGGGRVAMDPTVLDLCGGQLPNLEKVRKKKQEQKRFIIMSKFEFQEIEANNYD